MPMRFIQVVAVINSLLLFIAEMYSTRAIFHKQLFFKASCIWYVLHMYYVPGADGEQAKSWWQSGQGFCQESSKFSAGRWLEGICNGVTIDGAYDLCWVGGKWRGLRKREKRSVFVVLCRWRINEVGCLFLKVCLIFCLNINIKRNILSTSSSTCRQFPYQKVIQVYVSTFKLKALGLNVNQQMLTNSTSVQKKTKLWSQRKGKNHLSTFTS